MKDAKSPSLGLSILPTLALIAFLAIGVLALKTSPHIPLMLGCVVAACCSLRLGHSWDDVLKACVNGISLAMPAILILMAVGILIGSWVASGVVPLLVSYGLNLLSPSFFLVAACCITSIVAFSTGSSWSTAGTIGVALVGVGQGLGIDSAMVAGAIVSGAYFGDKLSPLSDTTNLASGVVGVPLFEHIRHMLYTTIPSMLIALLLYAFIGHGSTDAASDAKVAELLAALDEQFRLSPWLLLAPASVLALIAFRVPALPSMLGGAFAGAAIGLTTQDIGLSSMFEAMQSGYVSTSGNAQIDELLSRGGLESMFWTIGLIICAMAFGGIMERAGMLNRIANAVLSFATSSGKLVSSTLATCIGMNIVAPDQYLAIVVPGRMYRSAFAKSGLAAKNLSRCLEDSGTLFSPLVPWNSCGAFMMGALGVSPWLYLPYAFLNLLCPLISAIYGFTGFSMEKTAESSGDEAER
ncbi:Na+/H+ antiporter NhaC [Pelagicoccus sp. SDUM812003]|uniref:Na+/H+ antiporter NhaC n=1 Tax=Pelagicoccus sp. SDUM812003 TaxID=3041267 RepID=UPI00280CD5E7|nr:Na+/H+ antiporter NhaC [Pelagicoccus sp. SDUM812003]MDQ8201965.1 Na+/H+ antiporter NhaC [Pelagicoccus sp. SDUM812003]